MTDEAARDAVAECGLIVTNHALRRYQRRVCARASRDDLHAAAERAIDAPRPSWITVGASWRPTTTYRVDHADRSVVFVLEYREEDVVDVLLTVVVDAKRHARRERRMLARAEARCDPDAA